MYKSIVLLSSLLISFCTLAQELKVSDLSKLMLLPGKVNTYYSKDCETKALYLQELVQDAVQFFEIKLKDTFDLKLLVLNKSDWKIFVGGPYILPNLSNNPYRIETGVNELFKIKFLDDKTLYGKKEVFFWDFITVHELGHYISQRNKLKTIRWGSEFFANYIMIGFMMERLPNWQFQLYGSTFFKYLPLKYKSIEDFENKSSRIDPVNYSLYQAKFEELAYMIFIERGWSFMFEYIDKTKNTETKNIDLKNKKLLLELSLNRFQNIEPEIFDEWNQGMRQTYHSYMIIFILIIIALSIRFFDNSYEIFTKRGLKTQNRYRILGVPTITILRNLKSFEEVKIKKKLKVISSFRPVMYLCILLLLLLVVLHH